MNKINNKELREACNVLGLSYEDFVESSEIEKGVNDIDYKALYEEQKELNKELLLAIGKIPSSFNEKFKELEKGISEEMSNISSSLKKNDLSDTIKNLKDNFEDIKNKFNEYESSPLQKRKSFKSLQIVEKSEDNQNNKNTNKYQLSNPVSLKQLKSFLGTKTMQALEKGVSESLYEVAATQLDAHKKFSPEVLKALRLSDNIEIVN